MEDVVPYTLTGDGQGARPPKSEVADRCGEKPGMITGFNTSSNEFHKSSFLGRVRPNTLAVFKKNVSSKRCFIFI